MVPLQRAMDCGPSPGAIQNFLGKLGKGVSGSVSDSFQISSDSLALVSQKDSRGLEFVAVAPGQPGPSYLAILKNVATETLRPFTSKWKKNPKENDSKIFKISMNLYPTSSKFMGGG